MIKNVLKWCHTYYIPVAGVFIPFNYRAMSHSSFAQKSARDDLKVRLKFHKRKLSDQNCEREERTTHVQEPFSEGKRVTNSDPSPKYSTQYTNLL